MSRACWCLALFIIASVNASRRLLFEPQEDWGLLFGEQWIQQHGSRVRSLRIYLSKDCSAGQWDGVSPELQQQRVEFQADLQDVLSSYLGIKTTRIWFPNSQLPARSVLVAPEAQARDVRCYIDVTIDYPADDKLNAFPRDITKSCEWLLGEGDQLLLMSKWDIGVAECSLQDPPCVFTVPFPVGQPCDRTDAKCQRAFPLCNRAVDITPAAAKQRIQASITLYGACPETLDAAHGGVSLFNIRVTTGMAYMLRQQVYGQPGREQPLTSITVAAVSTTCTSDQWISMVYTAVMDPVDLTEDVQKFIQWSSFNSIASLLPGDVIADYRLIDSPSPPPEEALLSMMPQTIPGSKTAAAISCSAVACPGDLCCDSQTLTCGLGSAYCGVSCLGGQCWFPKCRMDAKHGYACDNGGCCRADTLTCWMGEDWCAAEHCIAGSCWDAAAAKALRAKQSGRHIQLPKHAQVSTQ